MKKVILFLSAITITLSSCSSSDSSSSTTNVDDVLPIKITDTYNDGSVVSNITYNGKKIKQVSSNDGELIKYTYTGDLITKVETFYDGELDTTETLTYNASGQLIGYTDISDFWDNQETYTYNSNGTVSFTRIADGTLYSSGTITMIGNDVSQVVINYDDTGLTSTNTYTYDTSYSPFKNIVGYKWYLLAGLSENQTQGFDHNVLSYSESLSSFSNYTSTYQYNSLDFPVSVLTSDDDALTTIQYN